MVAQVINSFCDSSFETVCDRSVLPFAILAAPAPTGFTILKFRSPSLVVLPFRHLSHRPVFTMLPFTVLYTTRILPLYHFTYPLPLDLPIPRLLLFKAARLYHFNHIWRPAGFTIFPFYNISAPTCFTISNLCALPTLPFLATAPIFGAPYRLRRPSVILGSIWKNGTSFSVAMQKTGRNGQYMQYVQVGKRAPLFYKIITARSA